MRETVTASGIVRDYLVRDIAPDAVREVDSGDENTKAFMCFENARDAELWDNQK